VPISFRSAEDKQIHINPRPDAPVDAYKLYVLVRARMRAPMR
jgi:hypothetical protein